MTVDAATEVNDAADKVDAVVVSDEADARIEIDVVADAVSR